MKVIILRGIPGSGKSTHAALFNNAMIVSADHYFVKNGVYKFEPVAISDAHNACLRRFLKELERKERGMLGEPFDALIVDNTNLHVWEIAPYYQLAQAFDVEVSIVSLNCRLDTALSRNIHNVPEPTIIRMLDDYSSERFPSHWNLEIVPFKGENV